MTIKPCHKPVPPSWYRRWEDMLERAPDAPVRVYTLQHRTVLDAARVRGWISGPDPVDDIDSSRCCDLFPAQYTWMREQMAERLPEFSGDWPIWAWPKRQNLRNIEPENAEDRVLIYARVPRRRILASDFHLWHEPLNLLAACLSDEEWDFYHPDEGDDAPLPERMRTWERIFNLAPRCGEALRHSGQPDTVQLCVDRIRLDEITKIRSIPRRGRPPSGGA